MSNNNINAAITNFTNALGTLVNAIIGDTPGLSNEILVADVAKAVLPTPPTPQGFVQVTNRRGNLHFQLALEDGDYAKFDKTSTLANRDAVDKRIAQGGDQVVSSLYGSSRRYLVVPIFNNAVTLPDATTFAVPEDIIAQL